ncbi:hypothetical protein ABIB38_000680 [Massilia sp. UYP11]|uniref:YdeI/OmpD-associated family protein n=1 Tax=Massilia sp. UYP11 TaxID=1756385 RepID=UPI003D1FFC90
MVPATLTTVAGVTIGDTVIVDVAPAPTKQEPPVPPELGKALDASLPAGETRGAAINATRFDWVHLIEYAKQADTRLKRVADTGNMLASSKKRVCCSDPSGYYSKSHKAQREAR